jgi:hypothetical protein
VVTLYGVDEFVPADALIVHVDLSVVPDEYLEFASRYPVVLNGRVKDIRKRAISRHLVTRGGSYRGPVIVKSDLNFAGASEIGLKRHNFKAWPFKRPTDYQVMPSPAHVPERAWEHPGVVIERFLPEREGGLFHIRVMVFLGDRLSCTRMSSPNPIVNGSTQVRVQDIEPHPEVIALKAKLGFDYGKFDYVLRDGEAIVFDLNKTVGAPPKTSDPIVIAGRRHRAEGLYAYFEKEGSSA